MSDSESVFVGVPRSMEIQLTDFENAAFTVFVVLLTRVILAFDLHLYIPISRNDENMARAHRRNRWKRVQMYTCSAVRLRTLVCDLSVRPCGVVQCPHSAVLLQEAHGIRGRRCQCAISLPLQ